MGIASIAKTNRGDNGSGNHALPRSSLARSAGLFASKRSHLRSCGRADAQQEVREMFEDMLP